MNKPTVRIAFRHMDSTEHLQNHINKQLEKVNTFLSHEATPITIDLVMSPAKLHAHHQVELVIKSPNYHVVVNHEGTEFYQLLDKVIDAAYRKLHEEKRRKEDSIKEKRSDKRDIKL